MKCEDLLSAVSLAGFSPPWSALRVLEQFAAPIQRSTQILTLSRLYLGPRELASGSRCLGPLEGGSLAMSPEWALLSPGNLLFFSEGSGFLPLKAAARVRQKVSDGCFAHHQLCPHPGPCWGHVKELLGLDWLWELCGEGVGEAVICTFPGTALGEQGQSWFRPGAGIRPSLELPNPG